MNEMVLFEPDDLVNVIIMTSSFQKATRVPNVFNDAKTRESEICCTTTFIITYIEGKIFLMSSILRPNIFLGPFGLFAIQMRT